MGGGWLSSFNTRLLDFHKRDSVLCLSVCSGQWWLLMSESWNEQAGEAGVRRTAFRSTTLEF